MMHHEVLIIGGGAAGMLSAIIAKENGKDVAILESGARVGRKLLTTGNGRCNISNRKAKAPYANFHSFNPNFYCEVLEQFDVDHTIELFYRLGLPIVELERGKLYPQSLQASSVLDIIRLNLEERNVPIYENCCVTSIKPMHPGFVLEVAHHEPFNCQKVIVATGGLAAPNTGSDGSIYASLKALGHKVTKQLPAIVQLKLDYPRLKAISGVRFDAMAKIVVDGKEIAQDEDEVLFTDYGISGPAILQISRHASLALSLNRQVKVVLDLFPCYTFADLKDFMDNHFSLFMHRSIHDGLIGVIHKKLIPIVLKDAGIDNIHQTIDQFTYKDKLKLYQTLKKWTFSCIGTNGFQNAQTTIGGIDTRDVNPKTLESLIVKGLYFAGEVLDVDGDCGGFNLQWAWSSGYVCGMNV